LVNAVEGNNRCLVWESYETHKYTLGKMGIYLLLKQVVAYFQQLPRFILLEIMIWKSFWCPRPLLQLCNPRSFLQQWSKNCFVLHLYNSVFQQLHLLTLLQQCEPKLLLEYIIATHCHNSVLQVSCSRESNPGPPEYEVGVPRLSVPGKE
jgi:hypothetical protein